MQAIELLLILFVGFVYGQPTLKPGTDYYCPQVNKTLTFFCNDSQIYLIEWIVEGYIPSHSIRYLASFGLSQPPIIIGSFTASLVNVTKRNSFIADIMLTKLIVDVNGLNNGTNITCKTTANTLANGEYASSVIYFSGLKNYVICCQSMHVSD